MAADCRTDRSKVSRVRFKNVPAYRAARHMVIECASIGGIGGSRFTGRVERAVSIGPYDGIVPSIEGSAHVIALNTIFVDDEAPFPEGFRLV